MILKSKRPGWYADLIAEERAEAEQQEREERLERNREALARAVAREKQQQKARLKSKPAAKPSKKIKQANGRVAQALKGKAEFKIGDPVPEKRYTAVSRDVFMCPEVRALGHWAKYLLQCLLIQYDGQNNGKLKCSFAYMHKHFGWGSPKTLVAAHRQLEHARLLARIEEGYKGRAARYGLINCLVPQKGVEK